MSPRKLSDSDKLEILNLYRKPEETTSTLAIRYEVSSSTISRLLKSRLDEDEYEGLIQQKRSTRTPNSSSLPEKTEEHIEFEPEPSEPDIPPERRIRKRSPVAYTPITEAEETSSEILPTEAPSNSALSQSKEALDDDNYRPDDNYRADDNYHDDVSLLEEMLGEDLTDLDDEDGELEDDLDEDWDDEPIYPEINSPTFPTKNRINVEVLPLSSASLPKTCYLVVDRAAELIARPLREFSDLGRIPAEEVHQKTLPVFDNHRVARRFSNRAQRVIKIPDGRMLQKTCSQLQAKGITRLLIDGQVYSLS